MFVQRRGGDVCVHPLGDEVVSAQSLGPDGDDTEGRVRRVAAVEGGGDSIQGHLSSTETAVDWGPVVTLHDKSNEINLYCS